MSEREREPHREPNFEQCVTRYAERLATGTAERVGRQDISVKVATNTGTKRDVSLAVVDERRESMVELLDQFGLMQEDDINKFVLPTADYPHIWQLLAIRSHKDRMTFGLQEVRADAHGSGLGSLALDALCESSRETGFRFVTSEPIDPEVGSWHIRHGAYVHYELEPQLQKQFDPKDAYCGVVVRLLDSADVKSGIQERYRDMNLEERLVEYESRYEAREMLHTLAASLRVLAKRLRTRRQHAGDLATAQEVIEDLHAVIPTVQVLPENEARASQVIEENAEILDELEDIYPFNQADVKLLRDSIRALA